MHGHSTFSVCVVYWYCFTATIIREEPVRGPELNGPLCVCVCNVGHCMIGGLGSCVQVHVHDDDRVSEGLVVSNI